MDNLLLPAGISFGQGRFLAVREKLIAIGFPKDTIQPFMLQVEEKLVNGESTVEFFLGKEDGRSGSATQSLLNQNDAFAPVLVSLGVQKVYKLGTKFYPGNSPIYTYPAPVFDGAATATSLGENRGVYGVWGGGSLSYTTDGKEIIYREKASSFMHYSADPQQAGSVAPTGDLDDMEQWRWIGKEFVYFGGNENLIIHSVRGTDTSMIAGDPADIETEYNQLVYRAMGWIIRGGADKITHTDAMLAQGFIGLN